MSENNEWSEGQIVDESKTKLTPPRLFKVILYNDDYTTMEFVTEILMSVFHKSSNEAERIMLDVHKKGQGICGIYTRDVAVTKVSEVHEKARQNEFPLRCGCEEV